MGSSHYHCVSSRRRGGGSSKDGKKHGLIIQVSFQMLWMASLVYYVYSDDGEG
jgi:hypothetical protein